VLFCCVAKEHQKGGRLFSNDYKWLRKGRCRAEKSGNLKRRITPLRARYGMLADEDCRLANIS
jgi:hypothetical protein